MPSPQGRACWKCIHFDRAHATLAHGFCRRHAPTPAKSAESESAPTWPRIDEGDWCGEYANNADAIERVPAPEGQSGDGAGSDGDG